MIESTGRTESPESARPTRATTTSAILRTTTLSSALTEDSRIGLDYGLDAR